MGQSTNGQICYGIMFDEGMEFPWDTDEYDGDLERWWTFAVLGFRRSFEMFTPRGEWIGGKEWPQEKQDEYFAEQREFVEASPPCPVELVNYCSYDFPMYILTISETCRLARRGCPQVFLPFELQVTDEQKKILVGFCKEHKIEFDTELKWYLSSFWG